MTTAEGKVIQVVCALLLKEEDRMARYVTVAMVAGTSNQHAQARAEASTSHRSSAKAVEANGVERDLEERQKARAKATMQASTSKAKALGFHQLLWMAKGGRRLIGHHGMQGLGARTVSSTNSSRQSAP